MTFNVLAHDKDDHVRKLVAGTIAVTMPKE